MLNLDEIGNPIAEARESRLDFIQALITKANDLKQLANNLEQLNEQELTADQIYGVKMNIGYYLTSYLHIMDMTDIVKKAVAYQDKATELYCKTAKESK